MTQWYQQHDWCASLSALTLPKKILSIRATESQKKSFVIVSETNKWPEAYPRCVDKSEPVMTVQSYLRTDDNDIWEPGTRKRNRHKCNNNTLNGDL